MLANNRGRDYDVYDGGERVLSVRYLTPTEPSDCCMCGRSTFDHFAVPYYCGPVRSGKSEGGYAPACQRCYDRWARWDDAMEEYDSWLAVLRERPAVMAPRISAGWKLVPEKPTRQMLNTWALRMPEPVFHGIPPGPQNQVLGWSAVDAIYRDMLAAAPEAPDGVPVVVAGNPSLDQGPCTVCGKPWREHGTYPVYESHHYTPIHVVEGRKS